MVSGIYERAPLVRDRPALRRGLGNLVGRERRRFPAGRHHSHASRQLHPPRRQDAALRRRQEEWQGTGRDCDLRHGADHLSPGQRGPAGFARALTNRLAPRRAQQAEAVGRGLVGLTEQSNDLESREGAGHRHRTGLHSQSWIHYPTRRPIFLTDNDL
jgi:hypothetical protein